ncbi:MAG TPA: cobalt ECF transporter T component CbiQ, partial [Methanomicrobiales archaeon]|nr:cobalt ECF transporter T component CbiQ [Methanomicrobiales archaeon]
MIDDIFNLEKYAYRRSVIHDLDARVKLIICLSAIIAVVAFPYSSAVFTLGGLFFTLFLILWLLSGLPVDAYARRLLLILPFGVFLIFFQIFLKNPYYTIYHPIVVFPFGLAIYAESVEFASILFVKFIVSISFIILLSSTSSIQNLIEGASRMGFPREFSLAMGMMVRYLFVFAYMFLKVKQALETRCFDPFNRMLSYRYRLRQMGYTIGTIFIRSYEQGERTYQ